MIVSAGWAYSACMPKGALEKKEEGIWWRHALYNAAYFLYLFQKSAKLVTNPSFNSKITIFFFFKPTEKDILKLMYSVPPL